MFWNRKPKVKVEEITVMEKAPACVYCAQLFEASGLQSYQAAHYLDDTEHGKLMPVCREHHKYCTGRSFRIILAGRQL